MAKSSSVTAQCHRHPLRSLLVFFVVWKTVLIVIARLSPGPGYDTSTSLLQHQLARAYTSDDGVPTVWRGGGGGGGLLEKLTRWDAIYYTRIAQRDYAFEQEWAFGWGLTRVIKFLAKGLAWYGFETTTKEMAAGVLLSNVSHLASVFTLYALTKTVFSPESRSSSLAFVTAALHIISPAGLFLSAPGGESLFSLLSFASQLLYAKSVAGAVRANVHSSLKGDLGIVLAGAVGGLATTVRSNGLLGGLPFLVDALLTSIVFLRDSSRRTSRTLLRLTALVLGGTCLAAGLIVPQWIAYDTYCTGSTSRPWCSRWLPSIYSWNQDHYWNVGFLRYWSLSNLPLFVLAAPMLIIMTVSAIWALQGGDPPHKTALRTTPSKSSDRVSPAASEERDICHACLWRFALPQLVLTILAIFVYHVQIITRISSGYTVWYWWLARAIVALVDRNGDGDGDGRRKWPMLVVRWMVIYAIVQGGLFASFLPPA